MPRSSVAILLSLMVFTALSGTFAWGAGVTFVHHVRGSQEAHPAAFLLVYLVLCGLILREKALGWQILFLLSAIQLLGEFVDIVMSESTFPLLEWLFIVGAASTAIFCFKNRVHFD